MNADACSIYLLDTISGNLILEAAVGVDQNAIKNVKMRLDEGITGWVVRNGKPVALPETHSDARVKFISEIHEERLSSLLSVPLGDKKDCIGAINIQTINQRKYTYEDIRGSVDPGKPYCPCHFKRTSQEEGTNLGSKIYERYQGPEFCRKGQLCK